METPAERLRRLLQHFGWNDAEFARRIGVSKSLVNRAMKGERAVSHASPTIVLAAFHKLGVRPEYWSATGPAADFIGPQPSAEELDAVKIRRPGRAVLSLGDLAQVEDFHEQMNAALERDTASVLRRSKHMQAVMLASAFHFISEAAAERFRNHPHPTADRIAGIFEDAVEEKIAPDWEGMLLQHWTLALMRAIRADDEGPGESG